MAELWWDSAEDLDVVMAAPEAQRATQEFLDDEGRFIDLERSPLWMTQEHPSVEPSGR